MANTQEHFLSAEQQAHFLERGWVRIPGGIPKENVQKFTRNVWVRLGYSPTNKLTWASETVHMPRHREIPHKEFAPDMYKAMCENLFYPLSICIAHSLAH